MIEQSVAVLARSILDDAGGAMPRADLLGTLGSDLCGYVPADQCTPSIVDEVLHAVTGSVGPLLECGDQVVDLTVVADGTVLTHRLTAEEITEGRLDLSADLGLIGRMAEADGGLHLADATPLDLERAEEDSAGIGGTRLATRSLSGPAGWLGSLSAGTVVAVSASEGWLSIEAADSGALADASTVADELSDDIEAAFAVANGGDGSPILVEELHAAWLVQEWTDLDARTPPFTEILGAAGFEVSGTYVGRPGSWERHAALAVAIRRITRHAAHVDDREHAAMAGVLTSFDAWLQDRTVTPDPRVLERVRAHPEAAVCLEEELLRTDPSGENLQEFLDAFDRSTITRRAHPVYDGFRSLAAELRGEITAAETLVDAALEGDPGWFPAIERRIRFLALRGQAGRAAALLRQTAQGDDPELMAMEKRAALSSPTVGRNEPCPCGSGRKFKQCHLGKDALDPAARVVWLLDKARGHVGAFAPDLVDRLGHGDFEAEPSDEAIETEALVSLDMAIFESGGMAHFVEQRRALLPQIEVEMAERWMAGHRASVYRVEARTDAEVTLVDQRDGERFSVHQTHGWDDSETHDLVWCRLLPDGDRWWISGLVRPVRLAERARLLAASDEGVNVHFHAVLGDRPPRSTGDHPKASDGQPLVGASAAWRTAADPAAIESALDSVGRRGEPDDMWELVDDDGEIEARIWVITWRSDNAADDAAPVRLSAETDSVARWERLRTAIAEWLPDSTLVHAEVLPAARSQAIEEDDLLLLDAAEAAERAEWEDDDEDDDEPLEDSPQQAAALEKALAGIREQFEGPWPDKPMAVLGGLTPREAVDDPERIDDVRTLLRELERRDTVLSADRLREALGLDQP